MKELAVIVARGRDDSISCYPVVETIHKYGVDKAFPCFFCSYFGFQCIWFQLCLSLPDEFDWIMFIN